MICIYCGSKTNITNSRKNSRTNQTWRRRQCLSCRAIFTSRETVDYDSAIRVQTSSRQLQSLSRDRLFMDIFRTLSHRKTALSDASALTDTILNLLIAKSSRGIIATDGIIDQTAETLHHFDKLAASVFRAQHKI